MVLGLEDGLVKVSGKSDSGEGSTVLGSAGGVVVGQESQLLSVLSIRNLVEAAVDLSLVGTEVDESEFGSLDGVLDLVAGSGLVGGADLLEDPVGDLGLSPASVVLDLLTVPSMLAIIIT